MVIMGKRNDQGTKASALMESIRQSVSSASNSSHPTPMTVGTVPPGSPPLIVRPPTVDSSSKGSPSASATAPESARSIVGSARIKNDMVDEVNKRKDAFKEQHPEATDEEIMENVQSQQIEVLGMVLKTQKGKEIRGMGRGGERDLSHSSNGSTSRSRPPRVDEQQLQEVQERYEQRLKESEERAQQKIQEVQQCALHAESLYSTVQSQFAIIYEQLGIPPLPPPQSSPPPQVSPQNNDDRDENI
ncbi:hypothetical protein ACLB2K_072356 [Fragaria x ananassa]